MVDDIVKQLRSEAEAHREFMEDGSDWVVAKKFDAAADEIERLRWEAKKAIIRGNGHAQRAIDTSDENMRLRAQIAELLPFAIADAEQGANMGPHIGGECDKCGDCDWRDRSKALLARIEAGEFG